MFRDVALSFDPGQAAAIPAYRFSQVCLANSQLALAKQQIYGPLPAALRGLT